MVTGKRACYLDEKHAYGNRSVCTSSLCRVAFSLTDYVEMVANVNLRCCGHDTDVLSRVTGVDFVEDQLVVWLFQLDSIISGNSKSSSVKQGSESLSPNQDKGIQISDFAGKSNSLSNSRSDVTT